MLNTIGSVGTDRNIYNSKHSYSAESLVKSCDIHYYSRQNLDGRDEVKSSLYPFIDFIYYFRCFRYR